MEQPDHVNTNIESPKKEFSNNEQTIDLKVTPSEGPVPVVETKAAVVEVPTVSESGKLTNTQVYPCLCDDIVVFSESGEVCDGNRLFGYSSIDRKCKGSKNQ